MIGDTAEEAFYLGNPRPADVKTLQLALPGNIRLCPAMLRPKGANAGTNDVLSAVVSHGTGSLTLRK
jgi:hypothetical protein